MEQFKFAKIAWNDYLNYLHNNEENDKDWSPCWSPDDGYWTTEEKTYNVLRKPTKRKRKHSRKVQKGSTKVKDHN